MNKKLTEQIMSTEGGSTLHLTEKDVVGLLMHAATRQDISELRSEVKQDYQHLENRIENLRCEVKEDISGFKTEIKQDINRLDNQIQSLRGEVKQDIQQLEAKVTTDIREIRNDNKWLLRMMVVSILVPIILHFVH